MYFILESILNNYLLLHIYPIYMMLLSQSIGIDGLNKNTDIDLRHTTQKT